MYNLIKSELFIKFTMTIAIIVSVVSLSPLIRTNIDSIFFTKSNSSSVTSLVFRLIDEEGSRPIANAFFAFESDEKYISSYTDSNGLVELQIPYSAEVTVDIKHPDFKPKTIILNLKDYEKMRIFTFNLEKNR